jgi:hypothetical protein
MSDETDLLFLADTFRPPSGKGKRDRGGRMAAAAVAIAARPVPSQAKRLKTARTESQGGTGSTAQRAKLERLTNRAPEVVVKVSGRQRGGAHTAAHLEYIGRHGKLDVETRDGDTIDNVGDLRDLAREWTEDEEHGKTRRERLTSISMVLSMPPGTDPDTVYQAAKAFARTELEHFPYAMALHTDEEHPHVHLTVAARADDGVTKFNPRKEDLAGYREAFARELRERGIEAEATPRRARGIVQKPERTGVRKMRERAEAGGGSKSRVAQGSQAQAMAMAKEAKPAPRPWEVQTVVRQSAIRADYEKAAKALDQSNDPADRELARRTRAYVADMPSPMTRDRERSIAIARSLRPRLEPMPEPKKARDADKVPDGKPRSPDRSR